MQFFIKFFFVLFLTIFFNQNLSFANLIKKIEIQGNNRISDDTIKLFSEIKENEFLDKKDLNLILKNLYNTDFFKDVIVNYDNEILTIKVIENPIIESIELKGIKSQKILDFINEDALIKSRSSYNELTLKKEKNRIQNILKKLGYYYALVDIYVENENDNLVSLTFDIKLGDKAKIRKISFIGNKIFKDIKLRRVISSTEFKFWKFLSGKKFLNEDLVDFDRRLLTNFYKNNGYYNVKVNSSFAKLINDDEFELIFNIDSKNKVLFGDISLDLPSDFDENNFSKINKLFNEIKGEPYSINSIDKILDEIDLISSMEQYQFINATVQENLNNDILNLKFKIKETEKFYIEKINILVIM